MATSGTNLQDAIVRLTTELKDMPEKGSCSYELIVNFETYGDVKFDVKVKNSKLQKIQPDFHKGISSKKAFLKSSQFSQVKASVALAVTQANDQRDTEAWTLIETDCSESPHKEAFKYTEVGSGVPLTTSPKSSTSLGELVASHEVKDESIGGNLRSSHNPPKKILESLLSKNELDLQGLQSELVGDVQALCSSHPDLYSETLDFSPKHSHIETFLSIQRFYQRALDVKAGNEKKMLDAELRKKIQCNMSKCLAVLGKLHSNTAEASQDEDKLAHLQTACQCFVNAYKALEDEDCELQNAITLNIQLLSREITRFYQAKLTGVPLTYEQIQMLPLALKFGKIAEKFVGAEFKSIHERFQLQYIVYGQQPELERCTNIHEQVTKLNEIIRLMARWQGEQSRVKQQILSQLEGVYASLCRRVIDESVTEASNVQDLIKSAQTLEERARYFNQQDIQTLQLQLKLVELELLSLEADENKTIVEQVEQLQDLYQQCERYKTAYRLQTTKIELPQKVAEMNAVMWDLQTEVSGAITTKNSSSNQLRTGLLSENAYRITWQKREWTFNREEAVKILQLWQNKGFGPIRECKGTASKLLGIIQQSN
ncbi:MAG: hypothetical protein ACPGUD_02910 [Parashewanella sp.]